MEIYCKQSIEWLENVKFKKFSKFDHGVDAMVKYLDVPCAFDIETTSTMADGRKFAFMYVWTFGIIDGDCIYYGRTWDSFIELLEVLQKHLGLDDGERLVCYVHNLGFEFQFMRKYLEWRSVFAVDDRKPIKALCQYGIEFRDSYILSNYSLEKLAENLTSHDIKKLSGSLDYKLARHSKTPLTDLELAYMNNDVEILLAYIDEQITQYGAITKIPLTNTGRVRDFVRNNCLHYNKSHRKESAKSGKIYRYRELMKELSLTLEEYAMLKRCFQGGFTHVSIQYSGKVLKDVHSVDFTSSYPYVMLSEKYPMSRPIPVEDLSFGNLKNFKSKGYGYIADVELEGVEPKYIFESYISESKCSMIESDDINNGRVYSAKRLVTSVTDVDMDIIFQCYDVKKITILKAYSFYMQYLPRQILLSILELYQNKTRLKGVPGKETEYLVSKGMLNSVYGMCVTDIIRDEILYENDSWDFRNKKTLHVGEMEAMIEKHNKSWRRFLYYPWGVYVTAYARYNLWQGILAMGDDYVYSDTDSIKYLNHGAHEGFIKSYNKQCAVKLKAMCNFRRIDFKMTGPRNAKGVKKPIGVFDYEGVYGTFKSLGAKRYMVEREGKVQLTVAGLSKQNGVKYMMEKCGGDLEKVFKMFDDELTIPAGKTGKLTHTYIDEGREVAVKDYKGAIAKAEARSSVHLSDCEFSLSISRQYAAFLKAFMEGYISKRAFV